MGREYQMVSKVNDLVNLGCQSLDTSVDNWLDQLNWAGMDHSLKVAPFPRLGSCEKGERELRTGSHPLRALDCGFIMTILSCQDTPTVMNCAFNLWNKTNPFSVRLCGIGNFITATGKISKTERKREREKPGIQSETYRNSACFIE